MKSGEHAIWDAAVYRWQMDELLGRLHGASHDALVQFELRFRESVTTAAEAVAESLKPLLTLARALEDQT